MRPENLRWAAWQWEHPMHMQRIGGRGYAFISNSTWREKWYNRLFSENSVKELAELGITAVSTRFYNGYGLEAEKHDREDMYEFYDLCHKYGIKVFGYVQSHIFYYETFSDKSFLERIKINFKEKPKLPDKPFYYGRSLCMNYQENIDYLKLLMKIGYEHGLDGFHFDWWYSTACYCDKCQELFRKYLKAHVKDSRRLGFSNFEQVKQPPLHKNDPDNEDLYFNGEKISDPLMQLWIDFRVERFTMQQQELYEYMKSLSPELGLTLNNFFAASDAWALQAAVSAQKQMKYTDAAYIEGNKFPRISNDCIISQIHDFKIADGASGVGIPTNWLLEEKDGRQSIVLPSTSKQVELSLAEAATFGGVIGSNWASRTTGGNNIALDNPELKNALREYLAFFKTNKQAYAVQRRMPEAALLFSENSFSFGGHDVYRSFVSVESVLLRHKVPFSILMDGNLDLLSEYKILILPNQCSLSEYEIELIVSYVKNGGLLIATGKSGYFNENMLWCENPLDSILKDNPNCRFLPDSPEFEAEKQPMPWWPSPYACNSNSCRKLIDTLNNLFPPTSRFFQLETEDFVFAEPVLTANGKLVLHMINYNNTRKIENALIKFNSDELEDAECEIKIPENKNQILSATITGGMLKMPVFSTYALVEIQRG